MEQVGITHWVAECHFFGTLPIQFHARPLVKSNLAGLYVTALFVDGMMSFKVQK